ncbi:ferredoxin reductase family protein [Lacisediminihabitans changchengi]|uniref:Ferric reductase-like transmembrane domain-containing protein n=1 Tax=Lacisediminihabitans changchengi TaxID=2787634 RepID=A0A934SHE7_9MICO|nr:ferredoxin reductase family protein [Lacisediminihabitans changchengi]MBK4346686.1 ferric reductase-like transmembrane domain-containing protein [Lacisediminihabitans changchengi]
MTTTVSAPEERMSPPDHSLSHRRRAARAALLTFLVWASGVVAGILFLTSSGSAPFGSLGAAISSVGILAGLVGTDFILVMLVLAARIPAIDATIGHDRAIAVHRKLGKPALYLLLGHGALLTIGYAIDQGVNPFVELANLWATPDVPLAIIAIGLLIAVVVTSLVAVRRRFSYEGWHLIHLLSYVAVAFALPHQLSLGGVLATGTVQRIYWITLYALAFGAIGIFRFIEPAVSSLRHRIRVSEVETISPGVVSIHLTGRDLRALGSHGGQFFVWRFWTGSTWWHSHPISLSSVSTETTARITVRDLGVGSRYISTIPVGTAVSLEGPYGLFTPSARTAPKLAIVAAGIGITPARALLEQSDLRPGEATVLLRASSTDDAYLWAEMADLAERKGARLYTMTGPRSITAPTWMTAADAQRGVSLRSVFPELLSSDLYVCGPTAWLDAIEADARAAGLPDHQLHSERFEW